MSDAVNRFIAGLGQKSGQATTQTVDVPKHVNRRDLGSEQRNRNVATDDYSTE